MNKQVEGGPQREQRTTIQAPSESSEPNPCKVKQLGMMLVSPGLDEDRLSERMILKIKKSKDIEKDQKLLISKLSQREEEHTNKPPAITISSPEHGMPFKQWNHSLKRKMVPPALNLSSIPSSSQMQASKSAPPNVTRFPHQQINPRVRYMGRIAAAIQECPSPIIANPYVVAPHPYAGLSSVPYYPYIPTPTHTHPYPCEGYYPSLYPTPMHDNTMTSSNNQGKRRKHTRRSSNLNDLTSRKKNFISKQRTGDNVNSEGDRETESPVAKQVLGEDVALNDDMHHCNANERVIAGEINLHDDVFKFEVHNDKDEYMKTCERIWNEWQNLKK
ncbi:hypothetical protein GRS66_006264 [Saccharomyces pastorianus]|uniref:Down-regulator of invasive growth n=1 Tax=Saccharomyces pastorianus TaxID=27292 RepID=A0A6C1E369_SACPS|nr:hypothetical protein GRS66_006264 [Saccharomyces pastorianus]